MRGVAQAFETELAIKLPRSVIVLPYVQLDASNSSLAGARRCAGARCEDGKPLEKGVEVVIERYEKGIAYVKRWDDFTK